MKNSHLSLIFILIMVIATFGVLTVNASVEQERTVNLAEETKIREVVFNYFNRRYRSRETNRVEDFRELLDGSPQANSFLKYETDKLEIEIYNAKIHHLRYTQYEYTLNFNEIVIEKESQMTTISLTEGHDVVFEISKIISKSEPVVSKMRNLDHTIHLKKTQEGWRIVSDNYDDYLWRLLRATNLSKEEVLLMVDDMQDRTADLENVESTTSFCNLPFDESTHPYSRSGAITYAHQYAIDPNPAYYYFPRPYGDCTNFVNQAIHHGSNAEEVGSNTSGWYYNYYNNYEDNDYSASWTDVEKLYEFISQYNVWNKGPEGCLINNNYAALGGDLVQFEWNDDGDSDWDHTVIIVRKETPPGAPDNPSFYVAGHSDDIDNYPLSSIIYQSRQFIRIERIDGYAKVYMPLALKNTLEYIPNFLTDPYPAPLEKPVKMSPYPAP